MMFYNDSDWNKSEEENREPNLCENCGQPIPEGKQFCEECGGMGQQAVDSP